MGNYIFTSDSPETELFTLVEHEQILNQEDVETICSNIVTQNNRFYDCVSLLAACAEQERRQQNLQAFYFQVLKKQQTYMQRQSLQHEMKWYIARKLRKKSVKKIQRWWRNLYPELRVCEEDGLAYSYDEFVQYYGGTQEWERSPPYIGPIYFSDSQLKVEKTPAEKRRRRRKRKQLKRRKKTAAKKIQTWFRELQDLQQDLQQRRWMCRFQQNFVSANDVTIAMRKARELELMESMRDKVKSD